MKSKNIEIKEMCDFMENYIVFIESHKDCIKEISSQEDIDSMKNDYLEIREQGKKVLPFDFGKINFMLKFKKNILNETIIKSTNFITVYLNKMENTLTDNDNENLKLQKEELELFFETVVTQFKPIKEELDKVK